MISTWEQKIELTMYEPIFLLQLELGIQSNEGM